MSDVYFEGSPNSFYLDFARVRCEGGLTPGVQKRAQERLNHHGEYVREQIRKGSAEGRAALAQVREKTRSDNPELNLRELDEAEKRAASDSTIVGFSTPQYIENLWATYRGPEAAFADAAHQLQLPPVGLTVHVPSFTSAPTYAQQTTENTGVSTSSPTGGYISDPINVETFAGAVPVSQELLDRGGYVGEGGNFDAIVATQLMQQANVAWDQYVIAQAVANASTVTQAAALTIPLLYANLTAGRESMANAAGYYGRATHVFANANVIEWAFKQVDGEQRPIITPDPASLIAADPAGVVSPTTFTGVWLNRQPWFEDDNIPTVSGNEQVILADMREVFAWKGSPVTVVYPETNANTLSVLIRSSFYGAATVRFNSGVVQITGAGYANIS